MSEARTLFGGEEGNDFPPPATLPKKAFGEALGLSPARVTQLIEKGLPVEPSGRIHLGRGRAWYEANVDPNRRRGAGGQALAPLRGARAELERSRADREALKLAQERGQLVDREGVERETFTRARAERDAWLGWVGRASSALAADLGAEPAATYATLDRLVREQLAGLAATPLEDLDR